NSRTANSVRWTAYGGGRTAIGGRRTEYGGRRTVHGARREDKIFLLQIPIVHRL
ncbi:unnamed protein product, partial [Nesidiocoris tenuis]